MRLAAFQKFSPRNPIGRPIRLEFSGQYETATAAVIAQTFGHKGDEIFGDGQIASTMPEALRMERIKKISSQIQSRGSLFWSRGR
jgi:hypothetical protein